MLATLSNYVKTHERLLIVMFGIILVWFVAGKIQDVIGAHDQANLAAEKATLSAQIDKNQALSALVADQAAAYKLLADKVSAQNAALVAALAARQKADAALPLPELAVRWQQLVPEAQPTASQAGLTLNDAGSHATVAALEQVPVLTQQLTNANSLLLTSRGQIDTLNERVSGLILQQTDSDKVCAAQIKVVKDAARKSKRKWFVAGLVAGLATRILFKF